MYVLVFELLGLLYTVVKEQVSTYSRSVGLPTYLQYKSTAQRVSEACGYMHAIYSDTSQYSALLQARIYII